MMLPVALVQQVVNQFWWGLNALGKLATRFTQLSTMTHNKMEWYGSKLAIIELRAQRMDLNEYDMVSMAVEHVDEWNIELDIHFGPRMIKQVLYAWWKARYHMFTSRYRYMSMCIYTHSYMYALWDTLVLEI